MKVSCKDVADRLGCSYVVATGLVKVLVDRGLASLVEKKFHESGKGKPTRFYEVADEFTFSLTSKNVTVEAPTEVVAAEAPTEVVVAEEAAEAPTEVVVAEEAAEAPTEVVVAEEASEVTSEYSDLMDDDDEDFYGEVA